MSFLMHKCPATYNPIILELIQELEMDVSTSSSASAVEIEVGTECSGSNTQEAGTQTSPSRMNAYTQVKPKTSTKS